MQPDEKKWQTRTELFAQLRVVLGSLGLREEEVERVVKDVAKMVGLRRPSVEGRGENHVIESTTGEESRNSESNGNQSPGVSKRVKKKLQSTSEIKGTIRARRDAVSKYHFSSSITFFFATHSHITPFNSCDFLLTMHI
jgi:hypothetical protein